MFRKAFVPAALFLLFFFQPSEAGVFGLKSEETFIDTEYSFGIRLPSNWDRRTTGFKSQFVFVRRIPKITSINLPQLQILVSAVSPEYKAYAPIDYAKDFVSFGKPFASEEILEEPHDIEIDGLKGAECTGVVNQQKLLVRFFLGGGYLYQVSFIAKKDTFKKDYTAIERYINSFEVVSSGL